MVLEMKEVFNSELSRKGSVLRDMWLNDFTIIFHGYPFELIVRF
jgi:hypothetical protein